MCPVCHRSAEIILVSQLAHVFPAGAEERNMKMQLLFRCPRQACGTHFLVEYDQQSSMRSNQRYFGAKQIYPKMHKEAPVADGIPAISPTFVKILQQATVAHSQGLNEVSGIGYRKALEFLIKDYCIHKNPSKEAAIRGSLLGQCINDFVSDVNVKDCATRAAWLGNDEAHYERVWTSHDVEDLKVLIQLTQNWIASELLTTKYRTELTKRKPKGTN
jgi:hypothetical protein